MEESSVEGAECDGKHLDDGGQERGLDALFWIGMLTVFTLAAEQTKREKKAYPDEETNKELKKNVCDVITAQHLEETHHARRPDARQKDDFASAAVRTDAEEHRPDYKAQEVWEVGRFAERRQIAQDAELTGHRSAVLARYVELELVVLRSGNAWLPLQLGGHQSVLAFAKQATDDTTCDIWPVGAVPLEQDIGLVALGFVWREN